MHFNINQSREMIKSEKKNVSVCLELLSFQNYQGYEEIESNFNRI